MFLRQKLNTYEETMIFKDHEPTKKLLEGLEGIEIGGAAHNPFHVNAKNVAPQSEFAFYAAEQARLGNDPLPIDIDAYADDLPLEDNSVDFVLSSHVVEHIARLITTFREWKRVVKPGGYIVMIVPLPTALPQDAARPLTTLEDIENYHKKPESIPDHSGHVYVFTAERLKEVIHSLNHRGRWSLNWELVGEESPDSKVGNGFWLAYRQG
jgi:SAM-dependent methyltransferase